MRLIKPHVFSRGRTSSPVLPLGPDGVEVGARSLVLGDGVCTTFAIIGYPAEVGPGWLEPLLSDPGRTDVALHVEPIPNQVAADRLRKRLARLESTARSDAERGRLVDFEADAAADDAHALASGLARGHAKLFHVALYVTVHAATEDELAREVRRVRTLAASLLLDARPATFRTLQGWTSTLPLGLDAASHCGTETGSSRLRCSPTSSLTGSGCRWRTVAAPQHSCSPRSSPTPPQPSPRARVS